jgi:hypothetical protein
MSAIKVNVMYAGLRRQPIALSALLSTVILFAMCACDGAKTITNGTTVKAAREPTSVERKNLRTATRNYEGIPVQIKIELISTTNRAWARIQIGGSSSGTPDVSRDDILFHRRGHAWLVAYVFNVGQPSDGGCAYAPADVMRDLYATTCPPERALYARNATAREQRSIRAAMIVDPLTRRFGDVPLEHCRSGKQCKPGPCVSELDPKWASAIMNFSSTSGVVWLRRAGSSWRVADETSGKRGVLPPHSIVLSLAYCVGYNAAQYGG